MKTKDETGNRYGRWTVLELDMENEKSGAYWICKCDCGKVKSVYGSRLRSGKSLSCGCLAREKTIERAKVKIDAINEELIGKRFERLVVLSYIGVKGDHSYYLCQCDCGKTFEASGSQIRGGHRKSCGCLQDEVRRINGRKNAKDSEMLGKTFGKLTVIERNGSCDGNAVYKCRCECGNEVSVIGQNLKSGTTRSCGCLAKEVMSKKKEAKEDALIGQVFGRLTVFEKRGKNDKGRTLFLCKCTCGNEIEAVGDFLVQKNGRKSCGCLAKERWAEAGSRFAKDEQMIGEKFGNLKVLERNGSNSKGQALYRCVCDCGSEVDVVGVSLRNGNTKSCGCLVSAGENKIRDILAANNIDFIPQSAIEIKTHRLRFDFAVLDKTTEQFYYIEYDGPQHYFAIERFGGQKHFEKQVEYDNYKNTYCKENDIPLIRIPYTKKPEDITLDDLLIETSKFLIAD